MTVTPLGRDQDCSLKIREPEVAAPWFLDPGGWGKTAAVGLYFIFPGICALSLFRDGMLLNLFCEAENVDPLHPLQFRDGMLLNLFCEAENVDAEITPFCEAVSRD
ncbi:hypothetical protein STEG23_035510, partial [Scotinomys teguina]